MKYAGAFLFLCIFLIVPGAARADATLDFPTGAHLHHYCIDWPHKVRESPELEGHDAWANGLCMGYALAIYQNILPALCPPENITSNDVLQVVLDRLLALPPELEHDSGAKVAESALKEKYGC